MTKPKSNNDDGDVDVEKFNPIDDSKLGDNLSINNINASKIDIRGLPGYYRTEDTYRPFTIFGNGESFVIIIILQQF